ncbi:hypothetical protein N3K66_003059 [Trichothecium roseum]|uniref:Uncharacterized protein n=1 Tax=Trichothecium roseum TaxID=47278 RepID=A0ACC0V509_9HYPO|nr:hypothetical protein N3K66_003059 [Trichothecium roseum]
MFLNFFDKRSSSRSPNQSVNDLRLSTPTSSLGPPPSTSSSARKTIRDQEPDRILITGAAGFLGQELAAALLRSSPTAHLTLTDINPPPRPAAGDGNAEADNSNHNHNKNNNDDDYDDRVITLSGDLASPSAVSALLSRRYSAIYLLHGLASDADPDAGWAANWDSHRYVIDYLRAQHPGTTVIFPSSLAVYGPQEPGSPPVTEDTCPRPRSSYGAQKLMVETYLNDMTRRGLLDARIARLPTVIVRPGVPRSSPSSAAGASSFCSAVVREPLRGHEVALPVPRRQELWVSSPAAVVENLMRMRDTPASWFAARGRVVNFPGATVTVQQVLDALRDVGGESALALVRDRRDERVEAVVAGWPTRLDTQHAWMLGMTSDVGLAENVRTFAKRYGLLPSSTPAR